MNKAEQAHVEGEALTNAGYATFFSGMWVDAGAYIADAHSNWFPAINPAHLHEVFLTAFPAAAGMEVVSAGLLIAALLKKNRAKKLMKELAPSAD